MSLTADQEPLAEALAIQQIMGKDGPRWIATRIGELALSGDEAGVERFKRIAAEYEKLLGSTVQ